MNTPTNAVTGRAYSGRCNLLALVHCGSPSMEFAGFNQWLTLGRCVRKGERGIHISLAPMEKKVQKEDGTTETVRVRSKTSVVFSLEQTEQVTPEQVRAILARKEAKKEAWKTKQEEKATA